MKISTVFFSLFIFLIPLLVGCEHETGKLEGRIGRQSAIALHEVQEIAVVKIDPGMNSWESLSTPVLSDQKRVLSQKETEQLRRLLLSDDSYIFDRTKSCLFIPEYAFLFMKDEKVLLTVWVSPSCKQVRFVLEDRGVVLDIDPVFDHVQEVISKFEIQ